MTNRLIAALFGCVALAASAGCGYTLAGRGNTLPVHIKTIGVPQCVNHTPTPDIDGVITDKLRQEFQSRGKYLINPDIGGADATLSCVINSVNIISVDFGPDRLPTRQAIVVTASIEFKDVREDKVLFTNPGFQARDEFTVSTGQSVLDANAFLRTNVQAAERLAQSFAKTIVTSILEAF